MAFKDYYRVLGIKPDATNKNIKDAYRRKASESHPDKHPGGEVDPQLFQDIGEAYEILVRPDSRKEYDRRYSEHYQKDITGSGGKRSGTGYYDKAGDFDRYVDDFFNEFFGRPKEQRSRKSNGDSPDHIHYDDLLKGPDDW